MENLKENSRNIEFVSDRPLSKGKWERVLDTGNPECWRFRLTKRIFMPFLFLVLPLASAFLSVNLIAAGVIVFILLLSIFIVKHFSADPTFDFNQKCFYCDRKKPRYGDVSQLKGYLPFSQISGIQILYTTIHGSKGNVRQFYELNLITDDLRRVFVATSSNYSNIRKAAEKIGEKLNVPVKENDKNRLTPKPAPRWLAFLFLIPFSGLGIFCLIFNIIHPLLKNIRSQAWPSVQAEVVNTHLATSRRSSKNGSYTVYKAEITYKYNVKGKIYSCSNYSFFHDFTRNPRKHRELIRNHPVGKKISCYFDPEAPHQAVIEKQLPSPWKLAAESAGYLLFVFAGAGIFLLLWSQRKKD